ncbi:MFS transporter [Gluconobacter thailandicus]|uniref:MFS transporter n=1 Tax=Gluconobacter thailandicus TaxID=257438 RepID=UPI001F44FE72|nr:MFS transporter [Gluconobacter thailandicus]
MAFLIFAMFNALWAPLVLPLSAPPFSLPHTEIGLFGFAGLAGALGAGRAGAWADHGYARRTTILCFLLAIVSWVFIAGLPFSIWSLIIGILLLDFAIQAIHVTSQSLILANARGVGSRIVGVYMTFYSLGSAIGAVLSTIIYAYAGWIGVSLFGGLLGLVGFFIMVIQPL